MKKCFSFLIIIGITINIYGQAPALQYKKLADEGLILLKQQNILAAIDKYKEALKVKQDGIEAHYGLGICYSAICIQNGSYCNEAINRFRIVEEISGGYRYTYRNMSTCYIKTYQYLSAIDYCNKAIKQDPKDGESYYYRGISKIELKQIEEGCLDFKKSYFLGFINAKDKINYYCDK